LVTEGPGDNQAGRSDLIQLVSIAGTAGFGTVAGANVRFPANSILVDAQAIIRVPASAFTGTGVTAANIWIGTSADEDFFFRLPVSASGHYGLLRTGGTQVCAGNCFNTGANATELFLTVNSQATATSDCTPLEGVLILHFARRA